MGYAQAMIEMALDPHLNSLESFEMGEKILEQNNVFELTQAILNEAKMIYFGNEIKEILEINYEEKENDFETIKNSFWKLTILIKKEKIASKFVKTQLI